MGTSSRKRQRTTSRDTRVVTRPSRLRMYQSPRQPNVYRFRRTTSFDAAVNPNSGFSSVGFDMTIMPTLANLNTNVSGTVFISPSLPNASEFVNLFDRYRIRKVTIQLFFSQNLSNTPAAPVPLIHIVNDYNSTGSFAKSDIYQMPTMKTYQLTEGKPITWKLYPVCRGDVLTSSGISSTSAHSLPSPWLDTSSSSVEHLGTRIFLDNLGRSTSMDAGTILFKFTYDLEFKNVK